MITAINIDFPFAFDQHGRTATTDDDDHVRDMIEQLLFTSPGERVNRPDFGSGLLQMAFAPNSMEMAAATQFAVQAALQKWLAGYVTIQSVVASADEGALTVVVTYSPLNTDVTQVQTYTFEATS